MESQSKTWLWVVAVVVLVALGGWLWRSNQAVAPSGSEAVGPALGADDTTAAIEQELNVTNLDDLDKELQSIDADANSL